MGTKGLLPDRKSAPPAKELCAGIGKTTVFAKGEQPNQRLNTVTGIDLAKTQDSATLRLSLKRK
jgi:hypothetical protein